LKIGKKANDELKKKRRGKKNHVKFVPRKAKAR
jgi:hypothetical protein